MTTTPKLPTLGPSATRFTIDPAYALQLAADFEEELDVAKGLRSVYPAEQIILPGHSELAWWTMADFIRSLTARIHIVDLGKPTERLPRERTPVVGDEALKASHWRWMGAKKQDGQGVLRIKRKTRMVTRAVWMVCRGGSPDTRRVVHRVCELEGCVNPFHAGLVRRGSWQKTS